MKEFETLDCICEGCGTETHPSNLYTDTFNGAWQMICPLCFYSRYNGSTNRYYDKMSRMNDKLLTEKKFNGVKSSYIVIANSFPYLREDGRDLLLTDKQTCETQALNAFLYMDKMKNKFTLVRTDMKSAEHGLPNGSNCFVVSLTAWVKFNSYLEYMEHEMYMFMRKELSNMIIQ